MLLLARWGLRAGEVARFGLDDVDWRRGEIAVLGKGNRGRHMASVEAMSLATSSAFTEQWRTSYKLHTIAGHDVFWR